MNTTSLGLLDRLKHARPDAADWRRLQELYSPLIRNWLSGFAGPNDEADDVAQEVLVVLVRELAPFERHRHGSFRAWLRQVTVNRVRAYLKSRRNQPLVGLGDGAEKMLSQLEDPHSDLSRQWDRDHDPHVFDQLQAVVKPDFEARTWEAFTRFALKGQPAARVGVDLGMSGSAVVQAKFRVRKHMRDEAGELME